MGFGYTWSRVFAGSAEATRRALTSPQTRRLAVVAPLLAVAFTVGRSWNRRNTDGAGDSDSSVLHGGVLVIVARHRQDLYDELSHACQGSSDIRVILDRRGGPPRKGWRHHRPWRGLERRCPQPDGDRWASSGVKVVVLPAENGLKEHLRIAHRDDVS